MYPHSYICDAHFDPGPPTPLGHGTVLLAVLILLVPGAIGITTTALILLVLLIVGVIVLRRWAISRAAARVGGDSTSTDDLQPELAQRLFAAAEQPHVEERFRTPLDQVEN